MQSKLISVIIPAYNAEQFLCACLDSVFAQTLPPYEVIVVNDGSADGTAAAARQYGNKVIFLEQGNLGAGAARNAGLRIATGEYVAFLDADDYWMPEFLERCVAVLTAHPALVAVYTAWIKRFPNKPDLIVPRLYHEMKDAAKVFIEVDNFFDFWAKQVDLQTGAILIRREVIQRAGYMNEGLRISQDLEYWGMLATYGKWSFLAQPLYVNNSRINARGSWMERYLIRRKLCPTVEVWQERIITRLGDADWSGFRVVRGRVAANFAHSKILGGDSNAALEIVKSYGSEMPKSWLTWMMRTGAAWGRLGWRFSLLIILAREYLKAWLINHQRRNTLNARPISVGSALAVKAGVEPPSR